MDATKCLQGIAIPIIAVHWESLVGVTLSYFISKEHKMPHSSKRKLPSVPLALSQFYLMQVEMKASGRFFPVAIRFFYYLRNCILMTLHHKSFYWEEYSLLAINEAECLPVFSPMSSQLLSSKKCYVWKSVMHGQTIFEKRNVVLKTV